MDGGCAFSVRPVFRCPSVNKLGPCVFRCILRPLGMFLYILGIAGPLCGACMCQLLHESCGINYNMSVVVLGPGLLVCGALQPVFRTFFNYFRFSLVPYVLCDSLLVCLRSYPYFLLRFSCLVVKIK